MSSSATLTNQQLNQKQAAQQKPSRYNALHFVCAFAACNIFIAYVFCIPYWLHYNWPQLVLARWYMLCMYVGWVGTAFLCITGLLPALLCMISPRRWFLLSASVLCAVLLYIYLFLDILIVKSFHFHISGIFLSMIFSSAVTDIIQLSTVEWLMLLGFMAAILMLQLLLAFWLWRSLVTAGKLRLWRGFWRKLACCALVPTVLVCWIVSHLINAWAYATFIGPVMARSQMLPFYYGLTAHGFLVEHHMLSPDVLAHAQRNAYVGKHQALHIPLHPLKFSAQHTPGYNIIFLFIDTWRADTMNRQTTPHIASFAQHNLNFTRHWSGGDCTQPGIFSAFYAVPASYWGSAVGAQQPPVFMDVLQHLGYHFAVHGSAALTVPPFNVTVFAHINHLQLTTPGHTAWQQDAQINQYMLDAIDQQAQSERTNLHAKPLFAFAFYNAVHDYSYPPSFHKKFLPVWDSIDHAALNNDFDPTPYFNIYKNAVLYDDSLIGKVLQDLRKQHLLKRTIVVISSDHGNEFNDNHKNYWGHASNFSPAQMHVPMVIHWPGRLAHRYRQYTSHFDLVPTLMQHALGVTNPVADYSIGKDLFSPVSWRLLVVGSYQRLGIVERNRITTFYRGGYFTQTTPSLQPIKTKVSPQVLSLAFKQMRRYYKR